MAAETSEEMMIPSFTCAPETSKRVFVDDVNTQDVHKLPQPKNHRATICVWTDLSVNDVDLLSQLTSAENIKLELAHIFNIEDSETNQRSAILLDLYYYTLQFARDNHFGRDQTSAFFSIVKRTHEACVETPFGNVESCFVYFKELVLCHAIKRPPFSIDLFSADEVRKILEYVIRTYFRHFKLYKYAFTPRVTMDLTMVYLGLPATSPSPAEELVAEPIEPSSTEIIEESPSTTDVKEPTPELDEVEEAKSELRKLIRQHLSEELVKLRVSVEEQIRASEDSITKKLQATEGPKSAGKDRAASSKAKKK